MVSTLGGIPQQRNAHFLIPVGSSIEGLKLKAVLISFYAIKETFNGQSHSDGKGIEGCFNGH